MLCEAFTYIALLHSNATSLATLHQSGLVNALQYNASRSTADWVSFGEDCGNSYLLLKQESN